MQQQVNGHPTAFAGTNDDVGFKEEDQTREENNVTFHMHPKDGLEVDLISLFQREMDSKKMILKASCGFVFCCTTLLCIWGFEPLMGTDSPLGPASR